MSGKDTDRRFFVRGALFGGAPVDCGPRSRSVHATNAVDRAHFGIGYEGRRLFEPEGIQATKRPLEALRGAMYTP
jgi:hypothetical protein